MEEIKGSLSKPVAVIACISMTLFYVATLYAPTLILQLPPPHSFDNFMIRWFICAAVSSFASVIICALLLPIKIGEVFYLLGVYGIQSDHIWQSVLFPLFLTSLMYAGSLMLLVNNWMEHRDQDTRLMLGCIKSTLLRFPRQMSSLLPMFILAPLTEELVFRACMISLLLCGGFKAYDVIFLCQCLAAHLNHMMEIHSRHNYSLREASMVVGLQLGYTVVFGSHASFLFSRTESRPVFALFAFHNPEHAVYITTFSWIHPSQSMSFNTLHPMKYKADRNELVNEATTSTIWLWFYILKKKEQKEMITRWVYDVTLAGGSGLVELGHGEWSSYRDQPLVLFHYVTVLKLVAAVVEDKEAKGSEKWRDKADGRKM
ncbi:CAAX prenyl protease 2-like [Hibiscus syriacus]|uniref:CAAX prenyl protease 2-like n=1 Tax=Hibiscus syriacus TaxID=106335 RepID=UPI00192423D9|nr:CAAX prenyl protease 2-like [Hibiscus syriacus]